MHISSLPGPYGIGELGAHAFRFIDRLVEMKLSVWQFLPIGPTAYGNSPYQSLSSFAGNEMLIDVANLVELGLLQEDELSGLTALPRERVDYEFLIPAKQKLLRIAAGRLAASESHELSGDYRDFRNQHDADWLHDYAVFRVLKTLHNERPWPEWAPRYANREAAALAEINETRASEIEAVKILQFLFYQQWHRMKTYANGKGVLLFGDLPIYVAHDSTDVWTSRSLFRIDDDGYPGDVAGVPPDYFSADGQLWGNPLYEWSRHESDHFAWWSKRLKMVAEQMDMVRIDHFRGFEAYWSIPAGEESARNGRWESGPGAALFEAVKEKMPGVEIVAEDLGVITPPVEHLRQQLGFAGMRVLQFDVCDSSFDVNAISNDRVCYTGTHDNDTTVGWFHGGNSDSRSGEEISNVQSMALRATGGTAESIHTDMIRLAFASEARLAIAPLQDYLGLGSEARFNVPGTTSGNWEWRYTDNQLPAEQRDNIASMVMQSGRGGSFE